MGQLLIDILRANSGSFSHITPFDLNRANPVIFDFTSQNHHLQQLDLNDEQAFNDYVFNALAEQKTEVGIGRYNEDRYIYKRSDVFGGTKTRSIHIGIDIWAEAGTPVYAPLAGKVHSFKNNTAHGDYGPTLILQHELDGIRFYTLYGHLSLQSITNKSMGQSIDKGDEIAQFGDYSINVHWPPHLHFQIVADMGSYFGDFPGVAAISERKKYLGLCPDPNLILNVEKLKG